MSDSEPTVRGKEGFHMDSLSERIAGLPPEKRKLFAQLLEEQSLQRRALTLVPPAVASSSSNAVQAEVDNLVLTESQPGFPNGVKADYRRFYDAVSKQLDGTIFGQFSFFLNYGYCPDHHPQHAIVELPEHCINRNSVRLVLELIGDCPLTGCRVLDVGCGRGGTVHVIKTMYDASAITGLDLSPQAIAFCRQAHADPRVSFLEGDAEKLPFDDGAFDVVTNVESSHSYPDINAFYSGVYRVLSPGGSFLYTDVQPVQQMEDHIALLKRLGFLLQRETDITSNVLLSCNEIARTRVQAFNAENDPGLMENFLAMPGSQVYEEMKSRRWKYRIFRLKKPSA
jgi:phthiocerol/phenolphthiocerol synthesis type-I polyketide synthase E